jgi:hypothetical protein
MPPLAHDLIETPGMDISAARMIDAVIAGGWSQGTSVAAGPLRVWWWA